MYTTLHTLPPLAFSLSCDVLQHLLCTSLPAYKHILHCVSIHDVVEANGIHDVVEANGIHDVVEANGIHDVVEANGISFKCQSDVEHFTWHSSRL